MLNNEWQRIRQGEHHDPFSHLGLHQTKTGWVLRVFAPECITVHVPGFGRSMDQLEAGCFELQLADRPETTSLQMELVAEEGNSWQALSAYLFASQLGELDLHLISEGRHQHLWQALGAREHRVEDIEGVLFAVWAPSARRVSVIGGFNNWNGLRHPMRNRGSSGVWEIFIPGLRAGEAYKFEVLGADGALHQKADPLARQAELRPATASIVAANSSHEWSDDSWMQARATADPLAAALSIYEVHPGSWKKPWDPDRSFHSWTELAEELIPWLKENAFTHVELLPVMEHPLDASWGYQVTGYFAPSARFGSPDDFRHFVDRLHQEGLGVILDWVPAHFPRDAHALARFDGSALYEHEDPRQGAHPDWGTLVFNFGRAEVRNFLIANALYWLEEFHVDGLRIDAVASMLYLDYSRKQGEWVPNKYGGRENLEAIDFLRELNTLLFERFPGILSIAEESTSWPMVSRPVHLGGLGFNYKWNMGWMNDTLRYFELDPVHRRWHHDLMSFSLMYAWHENFILVLSHDEVVHGKKSLLEKMPGDRWQQLANLRLLYGWMWAHPGRKLLFMGGEMAQGAEWSEERDIDWRALSSPEYSGVQRLVADLNKLLVQEAALNQLDLSPDGFEWINVHDAEHSVFAFLRKARDPKDSLLIVANCTPVPRPGYRVGVPEGGFWKEILNTDAEVYGGSNTGTAGGAQSEFQAWDDRPHSLSLTLPPLGLLILKRQS
jgi:1,4-alpha-glucan branching enzyme